MRNINSQSSEDTPRKKREFPTQSQRERGMRKGHCLEKIRKPFPDVSEKLIWVSHAAEIMGVHRSTIWNWAKAGSIMAVKPKGFSHHHLINVESLKRWHNKLRATLPL